MGGREGGREGEKEKGRKGGRGNEIEASYDKIIITIAPSYTGKNTTSLLPLALLLMLRTRNNTDGNKLVIFSGIASYYGDNYIISQVCCCPYCYECAA